MRIGVLQADSVLEQFQPRHGDYPQMFGELFSRAADGAALQFETIDAIGGGPYPDPLRCVTGSRYSVYEDLPWLPGLVDFVHRALAAGRCLVGICFGHQLIATALAGGWSGHRAGRWGSTAAAFCAEKTGWRRRPTPSTCCPAIRTK